MPLNKLAATLALGSTNLKEGDPRLDQIRGAYIRREGKTELYDPLSPVNVRINSERARAQASLLRAWLGPRKLKDIDILEIGCGKGDVLLSLIALGASPGRIVANELIDDRIEAAKGRLPPGVRLDHGDASQLPAAYGDFDLIVQSLVFSSILDDSLLSSIASRIWNALKPGGIILSYDFVLNNPSNPDVRGVSVRKLKSLFPNGEIKTRSLTLAPPIARMFHETLYPFLSMIPLIRTHALCTIRKDSQ